ncbi:MAG TPA: MerR family transcriptional regulator [Candidatus Krumholzibacteriaceae bacterium]|nr:MerR family transcriptional regulator [Candidatus Krumholzibacteriaceae bacterium]
MTKSNTKLYYSIGEVSNLLGVKAHVLRYWESQFPVLKPRRSKAGNRTYRIRDIKYLLSIQKLLHENGFTISGARKKLKDSGNNPDLLIEQLNIPFSDPQNRKLLLSVKKELAELKKLIDEL